MLDPTTGEETEINERGPEVSATEVGLFIEKLCYLARGASICVIAGSLPRGVDPGIYAELVTRLGEMGVTTVVDSEGEPMRLAVKAGPTVISPNRDEAEELVGHEFNDEGETRTAVNELRALGAEEAIMTLPDGCVASILVDDAPVVHRAWIEPREAVASVGSGDAFLAGYVSGRYSGLAPEECLRYAVACGAESIQRLGAGLVDPEGVDRLLEEVRVEQVDAPAATL